MSELSSEAVKHLEVIWDFLSLDDPMPEKADVIVGGGCKDTNVAVRAAELYHAGIAPHILFTGYQDIAEVMTTTEAELFASTARELGVPHEAIIVEPHASNTGENIIFSAEIIMAGDITAKTVVLVHKPYMSRRFKATAERQWPTPQPEFSATFCHESLRDYLKRQGSDEVGAILGDFIRMSEYVAKGFQVPVVIPQAAIDASQSLLALGFTPRGS